MHPGEVRVEHEVPVLRPHVLGEGDPLDARVVNENVDLFGLPVDGGEGRSDAIGISDVGDQVSDALARFVGFAEIEGEDRCAFLKEPHCDGVADAARCAGDRRDLARELAGHACATLV